ncbi:uridine kinase [Streptomyces sp. NPDC000134]|uniref:uridine kinase family protein n=1 Tax=Streptomyces sp. NPDC000134 TaxID=3364536 RepID=UPI0036C1BBE2
MAAAARRCQQFRRATPRNQEYGAAGRRVRCRARPRLECWATEHPYRARPGPVIHALAARLRALPPSCGPVRLIGVDGHAGSGKSTFAGRLAAVLGGAPVLHLDDIASHEELFDWTGRLLAQVIEPFARGEDARYRPYDWRARRFGPPRPLPCAPLVLLEGVGAGRRALRPRLAALLWMEMPAGRAWARGRARDGEEQREFWDGWTPAEREHFSADPTRPHAHLLVRQRPEGYEVLEGPSGTGRSRGDPHPE